MNAEKYQTIEEKILTIYSGKAEKLAQRKSAVLKEKVLFSKNSLRLTMRKLLKNLQEKEWLSTKGFLSVKTYSTVFVMLHLRRMKTFLIMLSFFLPKQQD
ncbi:hypothetical protein [Citrobacter freundii]|nr:hypothetical protein [Citrobacter freundii]